MCVLTLFLALVLIHTSQGQGIHSFGIYDYRLYTANVEFNTAKTNCINNFDGRLASITSSSEFTSVNTYVRSFTSTAYYLGGSDSGSEGTWKWVYDNAVFSYTNWEAGEPGNLFNQDCLEVAGSKWQSAFCSNNNPYVCKRITCFNEGHLSSSVCSGHGSCISRDTCTCSSNYSGSRCEDAPCFGIKADNPSVCSGHGSCTAANTCTCAFGFYGTNCSIPLTCNGILASDPMVCSGRGACTGPNTCSCLTGFAGSFCQYTVCKGLNSTNALVCNRTGTCRSPSYSLYFNKPFGYVAPYGGSTGNPLVLGAKNFAIVATIYKINATNSSVWSYDRNGEDIVQFRLESSADGSLAFYSTNVDATDAHVVVSSSGIISLNAWYTVVVSRRGLNISIWLNDTQVATGNSNTLYDMAPTVSNRPNFLIGARYQAGTGTATELLFSGVISSLYIVADAYSLAPYCSCTPTSTTGVCDSNCSGLCLSF